MHKAMKLLLKLLSTSKFDMKKNYQMVRDFQALFAPSVDGQAPIQDYGLPSLDANRTIPIRIFYPSSGRKPGAIIYFHGGGWVIGNIETYTPVCSKLAEETGQLVFSVDYRLAPEHPFPAGLEDCLTAAHLLIDFYHAGDQRDQGMITLCGDSAGANLAAVVSLFLRESHSRPADRQILFYPATYWDHDPRTSPFDSIRSMGEDYGLTSQKVQDYMTLYIPDPLQRKCPEVSPLLAHSLKNLPATLVLTAEYDPLRDEGETFALALEETGNTVELYRLLGAPHGYLAYPDWLGAVEETYRRISAFLEATGPAGTSPAYAEERVEESKDGEDYPDPPASRKLSPEELAQARKWLQEISPEKSLPDHPDLDDKMQDLVSDQAARQRTNLDTAVAQARQKRAWMTLDNASKIFPATLTPIDTKVFRFTAVMWEEVDPQILQEALDLAYDHFPLYHVVLRRGIFWYYFQESDLRPQVKPEAEAPVQGLYQLDRQNLLFRVLYYHKRISLEVFHALSDGNGAADFFRLLISHYVHLRYLREAEASETIWEDLAPEGLSFAQQTEDAFTTYFARPHNKADRKAWQARKAKVKSQAADLQKKWPRVYHISGQPTPDNRVHILECNMPLAPVLKLARKEGVSLSIYLTALFIQSINRAKQDQEGPNPKDPSQRPYSITLSVPVNLRSFYPSQSARNFFATVTIGYTYTGPEPSLSELCQAVKSQYQTQISQDKLAAKLYRLFDLEENLALRPIPRPLKDAVLKFSAHLEDLKLTSALSNMGKFSLPDPVAPYVDKLTLCISARRPQFTCISFGDTFSLSFCSPYQETNIQRHFLRFLVDQGVDITVAANNLVEERV